MAYALPFARLDRALCLAPALFRSVGRGGRGTPLSIDYEHGATRLHFAAPTLLGCDDLRVFVGVAALATAAGRSTDRGPPHAAQERISPSGSSGLGSLGGPVSVSCSVAELAAAAGYARGGGALGAALRGSLERLASLEMCVAEGDAWSSTRLLSWDERSALGERRLRVTLNDRSSKCALGVAQYARVDLAEARALSSDVARHLHVRWSAWIDDGASRKIGMDRLGAQIWGQDGAAEAKPAAVRRRRTILRSAFVQLNLIGWTVGVSTDRRFIVSVSRPRRTDSRRGPAAGVAAGD